MANVKDQEEEEDAHKIEEPESIEMIFMMCRITGDM